MKSFLKRLIRLYQILFSPRKGIFQSIFPKYFGCRFSPTCSEYSSEAIEKYGVVKGLLLGIKRIFRCNPLFRGGYDPLP